MQEQVVSGAYRHPSFLTGADLNIQLKDTYLVVSLSKEQSGFTWDELKGATITVESEHVWRAYVLVHLCCCYVLVGL